MMALFSKKYSGIISRQKIIGILKELFRKSIHLCSAFVPCFLWIAYKPTIACLFALVVFYSAAEILRLNGKEVFLISAVTEAAARKRDENKFVLGPVTLVLGIILSAILWKTSCRNWNLCSRLWRRTCKSCRKTFWKNSDSIYRRKNCRRKPHLFFCDFHFLLFGLLFYVSRTDGYNKGFAHNCRSWNAY